MYITTDCLLWYKAMTIDQHAYVHVCIQIYIQSRRMLNLYKPMGVHLRNIGKNVQKENKPYGRRKNQHTEVVYPSLSSIKPDVNETWCERFPRGSPEHV